MEAAKILDGDTSADEVQRRTDAFVLPRGEQFNRIGDAYRRGLLSVSDVADAFGVTPPDAVVLLEQHGFCRDIETIRLSEGERARILQRLRADRLARNGQPRPDPVRVARDVIASERIEGVDARRWINPDRR